MNKLMLKRRYPPLAKTKRIAAILIAVILTVGSFPLVAYADRFDDQIRSIESEVNGYQAQAAALSAQADTLQNKVNMLQANINAVQAQINLKQAEFDKLSQEIQDNQIRLDIQKKALSTNIQDAYIESSITPLEMVASSKSIGDYIDKQEYRNIVREQIQTSIKEIRVLQEKLNLQKKEVERVLADQNAQRATLAAQQAEQANLLAETQGQEAAYQSIISQKNSEIGNLRAQQAAANRRLGGRPEAGDPNRGGYPSVWANAPQDSLVDSWGMYNRECVSYAAWKVEQAGKYMPYWGGRGNANQWPASAQADGIPYGSTPRVHSVGISMSGGYGHAVWVEKVNGDGTIRVSQYNFGINGEYTEWTFNASDFQYYIYF